MFGTWKYDPETDEVQNLRKAYDPISARSSSHQACNRCHGKKLKCSGEKEGCERCITHGWTCDYDRPSARVSRKNSRASSRRGEKTSRRGSTPTSTTSPGSPDLPVSSNPGGPSSQLSFPQQASSSSPSTSRTGYMGTIDFSNTSSESQPRLGQVMDVPATLPSSLPSTMASSTPAMFPLVEATSMMPLNMDSSNQHYQWATSAAYTYPNAMSTDLVPTSMGDSQGNLYPATFPASDLLNDYRMQHDEPYFFNDHPEEYRYGPGHGHGHGHDYGAP